MTTRNSKVRWGLWSHVGWYVVANVGQVFTWYYATPDQFFWPIWSIAGWGIGLLVHIWAARRILHAPAGR